MVYRMPRKCMFEVMHSIKFLGNIKNGKNGTSKYEKYTFPRHSMQCQKVNFPKNKVLTILPFFIGMLYMLPAMC